MMLAESRWNGVMNRGLGSQPGSEEFHSQAGEISRNDGVTPSERPPSERPALYGDGHAGERVVAALRLHLA